MTNGQLEAVLGAMIDITQNRLPGALAWEIVKTKREVAEALGTFMEARDGLIKSYGDGGAISQDHENWPVFVVAFEELLQQEVTIAGKIDIDRLIAANVEVKPDSLGLLDAVGLF